ARPSGDAHEGLRLDRGDHFAGVLHRWRCLRADYRPQGAGQGLRGGVQENDREWAEEELKEIKNPALLGSGSFYVSCLSLSDSSLLPNGAKPGMRRFQAPQHSLILQAVFSRIADELWKEKRRPHSGPPNLTDHHYRKVFAKTVVSDHGVFTPQNRAGKSRLTLRSAFDRSRQSILLRFSTSLRILALVLWRLVGRTVGTNKTYEPIPG